MLTEADFQAVLPRGWRVSIFGVARGSVVMASNPLYGEASIGPKLRLVPADLGALRKAVDAVEVPPLTYSQWLAVAKARNYHAPTVASWLGTKHEELPHHQWVNARALGNFLRLLATCIERGDVRACDVVQALFAEDTYTVDCPIAEASNEGEEVAELYALGQRARAAYMETDDDED